MSVDMDVVGVMAAYSDPGTAVSSCTVNYTHAQRVRICCHNTDYVHVNGQVRTILVIFSQALYKAPWWWILCDPKHVGAFLNILLIVIVSTNYILCFSWIIKCSIVIDARCKYEDQVCVHNTFKISRRIICPKLNAFRKTGRILVRTSKAQWLTNLHVPHVSGWKL